MTCAISSSLLKDDLFFVLISLKAMKILFVRYYREKSYEDNFFLILMMINPVNHLTAIYPINSKKIFRTDRIFPCEIL